MAGNGEPAEGAPGEHDVGRVGKGRDERSTSTLLCLCGEMPTHAQTCVLLAIVLTYRCDMYKVV